MSRAETVRKGTGWAVHLGIAGMMVFAGTMKLLGKLPPEAVEQLNRSGIGDELLLIGGGELIAAVLLLVPLTSSLGLLMTSGFWGGVICAHMMQGNSYVPPSILLALTWLGGWLRDLLTFHSFSARGRAPTPAAEPIT